MKVLFSGVYRDGTGWGQAAIDYILAMDSVGIDIYPRAIKLNAAITKVPDRIVELEQRPCKNPDIVIQNILPHYMDYNGHIDKNIGLCFIETKNLKYSGWIEQLQLMDEVWVPTEDIKRNLRHDGIHNCLPMPVPIDITKFQRGYEPYDLPETKDTFVFYTIGEFVKRKNLEALLIAFHTEFKPHEPVSLFVKTSRAGLDVMQASQTVSDHMRKVKERLKLYSNPSKYKEELLNTERLTDEEMMRVHATCDCFVTPSFGEGWCIPAMDALGMGNPVICTDGISTTQFVHDNNGWVVPSMEEPVYAATDTIKNIFSGYETWNRINILELRAAMREAYSNITLYEEKCENATETVANYSYENIGNRICGLL